MWVRLSPKKALKQLHDEIEKGISQGAKILLDGRGIKVKGYPNGYFLGPTIFEDAGPGMPIFDEEICSGPQNLDST